MNFNRKAFIPLNFLHENTSFPWLVIYLKSINIKSIKKICKENGQIGWSFYWTLLYILYLATVFSRTFETNLQNRVGIFELDIKTRYFYETFNSWHFLQILNKIVKIFV